MVRRRSRPRALPRGHLVLTIVLALAVLGFLLAVPTAAAEGASADPTAQAEHPAGAELDPGPVPVGTVAAVGGLAALAAFLAGWATVAGRSVSDRGLHVLLGAAAGLLLTLAFTEMIPEALEELPEAGWIVVLVFFGLWALELLLGGHEAHGHGHADGHVHEGEAGEVDAVDAPDAADAPTRTTARATRLGVIALVALSLHRLLDGVTLPAAFAVDPSTGALVAGAVLVHQVPDGLAAGAIFLASTRSRRRVLASVAVVALWVPIGALIGLAIGLGGFLPHLLAVAAATFLFIGAVELLPELQEGPYRASTGAGIALGVLLALALEVLTEPLLGHA